MKHPVDIEVINFSLDEALSIQSKDLSQAIRLAEAAYQDILGTSDKDTFARASYTLGSFLRLAGSAYKRSERLLLDSLALIDLSSELRIGILVQLGQLYIELKKFEVASQFLVTALEKSSVDEDPIQHANILLSLAITKGVGSQEEAQSLFDSALLIFTGISNQRGIALTMMEYANLMRNTDRMTEAVETLSFSAQLFGDVGEERSRGVALQKLAEAHLALGNIHQALSATQSVLEITERSPLLSLRVDALRTHAKILILQGETAHAAELIDEAAALAAATGLS